MKSSPHGETRSKTPPKKHSYSTCIENVSPRVDFFFFSVTCCVSRARWANHPCTVNMLFIFTPATLSVRRWWLMLCCWVWTWVSLKITQDSHVSRQPSWQKIKGEVGVKQEVPALSEGTWKMQLLPETVDKKKKIRGLYQWDHFKPSPTAQPRHPNLPDSLSD